MPYWRLSAFYLFFFASLGTLIPYWSLYLQSEGFSAAEIGEVMAVIMATKVVAPNIWGWIADHTGRRVAIIRFATLVAAIAFAGVYWAKGFWGMAAVMSLFSFFWHAALPQFEATTLNHLGADTHRYSNIRLWGSIGFIVAVAGLGAVLDDLGAQILPPALLTLLAALWLVTLFVPGERASPPRQESGSLVSVLRQPAVIALFVVCFLLQASHGPYYTFYTIYMEQHGYSRTLIGQFWALGVVAEIVIFLMMYRLLPRFGSSRLLLWTLGLTSLRWLLIAGFPEQWPVMVFAQLLHAASFGVFHAVSIHLIHRFFSGRYQGRGQALYSSLSFGAGGALGSLGSGYIWAGWGPSYSYLLAAGLSAVALGVAWCYLKPNSVAE